MYPCEHSWGTTGAKLSNRGICGDPPARVEIRRHDLAQIDLRSRETAASAKRLVENGARKVLDMKSIEIFTPGTLPRHTYVSRDEQERALQRALEVAGYLVAITGPSKSGKTVLCEHVLGEERLVLLAGGGVRDEDDFWSRLRSKLALPVGTAKTTTLSTTAQLSGEGKAGLSIPFIAFGEGKIGGTIGDGRSSATTETHTSTDGMSLLRHIRDTGRVVVLDDFHYLPDKVRRSLAEQFKEAARQECKIILVSVDFQSDAVARANPELLGRVVGIAIPSWTPLQLEKIAEQGFPLLNLNPTEDLVRVLCYESLRSPQLMQALCLQLCFSLNIESTLQRTKRVASVEANLEHVFRQTAMLANCQSAIDIFVAQAKQKHKSDPEFNLQSGRVVSLAELILRALAFGTGGTIEKTYQQLLADMEFLRQGGKDLTRSVIPALDRYADSRKRLGEAESTSIGWDRGRLTLSVTDPYLMFYLRWGKGWANRFSSA